MELFMFAKRFTALCLISLFIALPVAGQSQETPESEAKPVRQTEEEAKKATRSQALALLQAVIKDTERLTLPENRIFISVSAGDLLWQHDAEAGRAVFKNAMADLRSLLVKPNGDEEQSRRYRQMMERSMMRQKLLLALARWDSKAALSFMSETRLAATDLRTEYSGALEEEQLELRVAAVIAANDPAQAVEMAKKTLAKGFSYALLELLAQVQKKDEEAAAKLTSDIFTKLKSTSLVAEKEAANIAVRIFFMAAESQLPKTKGGEKPAHPLMSEQDLREMAELIIATAIKRTTEEPVERLDVEAVMPYLEKYAPSRAAQLVKVESSAFVVTAQGRSPEWAEFERLTQNGTAEEMIAVANKSEGPVHDSLISAAAYKLANEGKGDEARKLINERITDAPQRQQMIEALDKAVLANSADKGDVAAAREIMARSQNVEERIATLTQLAITIAPKDNKVARQFLEEARGLVSGRSKYARHMISQLLLARAYATVEPEQAFRILEPLIEQLNELIAAGILLGEFFGEEEFVRDDELTIGTFVELFEKFQEQYGDDVSLLAHADFARTSDTADRFQRWEVRLFARYLVARSVLVEKKEGTVSTGVPSQSAYR
jgi:hypothetical protein